jgi:hypothetical protein
VPARRLDFAPLDLRLDTAWLPFPMFGLRHGAENVVWDRRLATTSTRSIVVAR